MPNTFFISDTHFNHTGVIRYGRRPFSSVEEMNEHLVQEWNKIVKPNDTIYHLGDFAFMSFEPFKLLLKRLNGIKHQILGNHDKIIYRKRDQLLGANLLESIQSYKKLKFGKPGPVIILFHYSQRVWDMNHYGSIHLYGHSHGSLPPYGKSVDVGVDCKEITSEYRPIHLDEVLSYMDKRETMVVDHHGTDRALVRANDACDTVCYK